jgi:hypothetical protein
MEGQAIYIDGKGEPVVIKDVNNPPAGVPQELTNFLKNIIKCDISFDEVKYKKEKAAADAKYAKDVTAAENAEKATKEYTDQQKIVTDKTADKVTQNNNITNLNAAYANKKHDLTYRTDLKKYNDAIGDDNHEIGIAEGKMAAMLKKAAAGVKKDEVKIEFTCKPSDACAAASKCPLRNLSLHKGTQKVKGAYKDTTTIRNAKVDKDKLKELNTDSIYFCPCADTDGEEDVHELVGGVFKKVE